MADDILLIGGDKTSVDRRLHIRRVDCTQAGLLDARDALYRGCDAIFWPGRGAGPMPEHDLRQLVKGVWDGRLLLLVVPNDYSTWSDPDKWVFNWFWSKFWLCVEEKPAKSVQYAEPPSHPMTTCLREIGKRVCKIHAPWPLTFNLDPRPDRLRFTEVEGEAVPPDKWEPKVDGVAWPQRDQAYLEAIFWVRSGALSLNPSSWREMWQISDEEHARYGLSQHIDGYYTSQWVREEPTPQLAPFHVTRRGKLPKSLIVLSGKGGIGIVPAVLDVGEMLQSFQVALESRAQTEPTRQPRLQSNVKATLTIVCQGDDKRVATPGQPDRNWTLTVNECSLQISHPALLKLIAFAVARLVGQRWLNVNAPMIAGVAIDAQFPPTKSPHKHKEAIQRAIYKTPKSASFPHCHILRPDHGSKGRYQLNEDDVTIVMTKLYSSKDPNVQKLLALVPVASRPRL